jgi:hypothetical protein
MESDAHGAPHRVAPGMCELSRLAGRSGALKHLSCRKSLSVDALQVDYAKSAPVSWALRRGWAVGGRRGHYRQGQKIDGGETPPG